VVDPTLLPEHATESSILSDGGHALVLMRVIHGRRTIELISLATNLAPIRFVFPARILPTPSLVFGDEEIHILACTTAGSIFRITFQIAELWKAKLSTQDWVEEYQLNHPASNLLGPAHANDRDSLFVSLKDGGILLVNGVGDHEECE
jgi:nuclear pore complex protein Nup160